MVIIFFSFSFSVKSFSCIDYAKCDPVYDVSGDYTRPEADYLQIYSNKNTIPFNFTIIDYNRRYFLLNVIDYK